MSKNLLNTYIAIILILSLLTSCKSDGKKEKVIKKSNTASAKNTCPDYLLKNKKNNFNISFLIDLSDRISDKKYPNQSMSYTDRDLGYIETISEKFINHIESKKLVLVKDNIQLYFDPPPLDQTINEKSKELKYFLKRDNITIEKINEIKSNYESLPKEIYSLAKNDNKFIGSDIWRFFKDKVKRYCIEKCNRNILIIITDGYMYHEDTRLKEGNLTSYLTPSMIRKFKLNNSKWAKTYKDKGFGFIPATNELNDLEVLVLGIVNHDKKNPYGKDVIQKYWSDWLESMGVMKYKIYGAELPSNMEGAIEDFLE